MRLRTLTFFTILSWVLTSCATTATQKPASGHMPESEDYVWLELGKDQQQIARAITRNSSCPTITLNGAPTAMIPRASEAPSGFEDVLSCEFNVPAGLQEVAIGKKMLSLPKANPQRIVVLGDTGCRMKGLDFQNCNGVAGAGPAWPFAQVAEAVAKVNPDLILHVGDYHYREAPCPAGNAGCAGSPYGFNWASWEVDFFQPGRPALESAPWVVVRGNHEDCDRAWRGWFYFLGTHPLPSDPWNSNDCLQYTPPYAIDLGNLNWIIMDSTTLPGAYGKTPEPATVKEYAMIYNEVNALADGQKQNWLATHRPLWGVSTFYENVVPAASMADPSLQAALKASNLGKLASSISLSLAGHVHNFEALNLEKGRPSQLIIGNGGTKLGPAVTTELLSQYPDILKQLELPPDNLYSITEYGFVMFEPISSGWKMSLYNKEGQVIETFTLVGQKLVRD